MAAQQAPAQKKGMCSCLTDAEQTEAGTLLRLFNLVNAALVIFAGIYTLIDIGSLVTLRLATVAISCYLACFGCVLCCFEMRIGMIEKRVRARFGFMFSYGGRTLFLFFIASFLFARDTTTTFIIGGVTLANAFANLYVTVKHGEYWADPTGKYTTAEAATAQYVQNNPELAQQAIGGAVNYARENPQLAQAGGEAAVTYARNNPDHAQSMASAALTQPGTAPPPPKDNPFSVGQV